MAEQLTNPPQPRRKPRRQPAFRDCFWPWYGIHHLRLEPNQLHRFAAHGALVGSSTCLCGFRGHVLACATDSLLYQRRPSSLLPCLVLTRVPLFSPVCHCSDKRLLPQTWHLA